MYGGNLVDYAAMLNYKSRHRRLVGQTSCRGSVRLATAPCSDRAVSLSRQRHAHPHQPERALEDGLVNRRLS